MTSSSKFLIGTIVRLLNDPSPAPSRNPTGRRSRSGRNELGPEPRRVGKMTPLYSERTRYRGQNQRGSRATQPPTVIMVPLCSRHGGGVAPFGACSSEYSNAAVPKTRLKLPSIGSERFPLGAHPPRSCSPVPTPEKAPRPTRQRRSPAVSTSLVATLRVVEEPLQAEGIAALDPAWQRKEACNQRHTQTHG